jgi:Uma2 family endonuclease
MGTPANIRRHTLAEWLSAPESLRLELIDGNFLQKASPSAGHGWVQLKVGARLAGRFNRRSGGRWPGGWWIASEVDIRLGENGFRPDLVGWRRERLPDLPRDRPVEVRPDWVCEIVSKSNASDDRVLKLRAYHQAGVPHYWLIDPDERTLVVMRHLPDGYLNVLAATAADQVRAEPFEAMELRVADFFEDELEDEGG